MKKIMIALTLGLSFSFWAAMPAQAEPQPYTVTHDNQLDSETYKGFKLYRNWCARCHGTYGQGLAGPNLADSLNRITYEEFMNTVAEGKTGRIGMMPPWKSNPSVMKGRDNIYSYLKARADGAIGEVKPAKAK